MKSRMEGADLFVGKRRISFDDMLMDGWSFKEYALQQYEKRTGKSLPMARHPNFVANRMQNIA